MENHEKKKKKKKEANHRDHRRSTNSSSRQGFPRPLSAKRQDSARADIICSLNIPAINMKIRKSDTNTTCPHKPIVHNYVKRRGWALPGDHIQIEGET